MIQAKLPWLSALAASVLLLLAPALWNGFPFMFYDSGSYIELGVNGGFMPERSVFYGLFLAIFHPTFSLWPAVAAQVLITVLVIAVFARTLLPGLTPMRFFVLILALCLGTGLPWVAAEVLPDILAPLLVISLYLLGFHGTTLNWPCKAALIAVAILGVTSHASHLGLAAGLAAVTALAQVAGRRGGAAAPVRPRWGLPTLVFMLSLIALVTSNYARTGDIFISRSGPAFLFARLVQDGIAKRVLDDTCPRSGYKLCAYKDHLPADSNDYLWDWRSPFQKLGKFEGTADESRSIIAESLRHYPLLHVKMAILDTAEQFITFDTGDGVEPLNHVPVPAMKRSIPDQVAAFEAARQQHDEIGFSLINAYQVPLGALSIVALAGFIAVGVLRRQWDDRVFLPMFLLLALIGNAFICGVISSPHDRYQSRLMWPASFAVLLLTARRPRSKESRAVLVPA